MLIPFEFNGIKSSVYGLYLCRFDGSNDGIKTLGNEVGIKTVKSPREHRFIKAYSTYETPLTFSFQVVKYECGRDIMEIGQRELANILKWLVRRDYCYLRFDQDGWDHVFYNCSLKVQKYEIEGKIFGLEIKATCDAPWGYSEQKEFSFTLNPKKHFVLHHYSDEEGGFLPDIVKIEVLENCDLQVANTFYIGQDPEREKKILVEIKNCRAGELLCFDRHKNISSSAPHDDLMNDFNYVFLELYSDFYSSKNTITANHNCNISMNYRAIRKGVPV